MVKKKTIKKNSNAQHATYLDAQAGCDPRQVRSRALVHVSAQQRFGRRQSTAHLVLLFTLVSIGFSLGDPAADGTQHHLRRHVVPARCDGAAQGIRAVASLQGPKGNARFVLKGFQLLCVLRLQARVGRMPQSSRVLVGRSVVGWRRGCNRNGDFAVGLVDGHARCWLCRNGELHHGVGVVVVVVLLCLLWLLSCLWPM